MAGFRNSGTIDVMFADNVDFSGATIPSPSITTNGQLLIGSTAAPNIKTGTITSPNGTITIGYSSPNITIDLTGGTVAIDSFIPNSGTSPVVPDGSGSVSLLGSGSITTVGGTNTITAQLTGLTNHAIQVGAGSATLTQVGPSATAGQILQSAGSSADPAFSTATYPSTTTANQILYSSATNVVGEINTVANGVLITNNSNVPSLLPNGTAGQVLTANSGAPPSWQTNSAGSGFASINIQTITTTGTYTPSSASVSYVIVELVGGGAGAAGSVPGSGGNGGGAGGYAKKVLPYSSVSGGISVTIGAGGNGGGPGNNGTAGTTTSFGAIFSASGGSIGASVYYGNGGIGGIGSGGDVNIRGGGGGGGNSNGGTNSNASGGTGGSSVLGGGGAGTGSSGSNGLGGGDYGGGGSGSYGNNSGGGGANGVCIVTEYLT